MGVEVVLEWCSTSRSGASRETEWYNDAKKEGMKQDEAFGAAMKAAYTAHGFKSLRQVEVRSGIHFTAVGRMLRGEVPGIGTILKWATAVNEPVNKWLTLAGYDPLPEGQDIPRGISEPEGEPPITIESQDVPQAVHDLIAAAETNDDKIAVAFAYVKSIPGIRFGAHRSDVLDTRIRIVRQYELITGKRLLPPEVR